MRNERGAATLELAIVAPALMLLILGILQFGLWYHAQHVVYAAAQEGARAAAAEGSTLESGEARALAVIRSGLGGLADVQSTEAVSDLEVVRVRVDAQMRGLLPIPGFSTFQLRGEASAFTERFRPPGDGS